MIRKELKEKFLHELTPSERMFFLKKAREAVRLKGYPPGEDLFWYCYYLTLRERLSGLGLQAEGYARFLFVLGVKDIEDAVRMHGGRLEKNKLSSPHPEGDKFIEYFSE